MQPPAPAPKATGSLLPVVFVLLLIVVAAVSLWLLTGGWLVGVALIGACVFGLPLLHYVLWGWWLNKYLQADIEAAQAEQSSEPDVLPNRRGTK